MKYRIDCNTYDFNEGMKQLSREKTNFIIEKNVAYGNSVVTSQKIMNLLYPNGISTEQIGDALYVVRTIDKLMRIATNKDAFGESPWDDIWGYAQLAALNRHRIEDDNESKVTQSHRRS